MKPLLRLALVSLALGLLLAAGCSEQTPQTLLEDARQAMQQQDMIGAYVKSEKALELAEPASTEAQQARFILSLCSMADQQLDEARRLWREIVEYGDLADERAFARDAYMQIVRSYLSEERFEQAVEFIDETAPALETAPEFRGTVLMTKAEILRRLERREEAVAVYEQLVESLEDGDMLRAALRGLRTLHAEAGDQEAAAASMEAYVENHPGTTLEGPVLAAAASFRRSLAEQAQDEAEAAAQREKMKTDIERSISAFREALAGEPMPERRASIMNELAQVLRWDERYDEAVALYQTYLEENPESPKRPVLLAQIAAMQEKAAEALPGDAPERGDLLERSAANRAEALEILRQRLETTEASEQRFEALLESASIHMQFGETNEAAKLLEDYAEGLEEGSSERATVLNELAAVYFQQGEHAKSLEIYENLAAEYQGLEGGRLARQNVEIVRQQIEEQKRLQGEMNSQQEELERLEDLLTTTPEASPGAPPDATP